ncbi:MAG: VOC family protein [Parasphingorhabdus sp.]|uniref:VOC family protein n=4 Tax=Parasphingorhabdus sp. TaxID=2709688 RepID=UPI0032650E39
MNEVLDSSIMNSIMRLIDIRAMHRSFEGGIKMKTRGYGFFWVLLLVFMSCLTACKSETLSQGPVISATQSIPTQQTRAFFALTVKDIDSMSAWYQQMLKVEQIVKADRPAPDGPVVILGNNQLLIEMQMRSDAVDRHLYMDGKKEAHRAFGVFKIGFFANDLDELARFLETKGANFNHPIVSTGAPLHLRTFAMRDPEGNTVQVFGE